MCAHFLLLRTFTKGTEHINEEKEVDLSPCATSWQYGLAGDHSSRLLCHSDKSRLQSKASARTSRSVDARLCAHLVAAVVLSSQGVMLQGLLFPSLPALLESVTCCSAWPPYLHKVWGGTGIHSLNTLHIVPVSVRVSPTGMMQIYNLDSMLYAFTVYISALWFALLVFIYIQSTIFFRFKLIFNETFCWHIATKPKHWLRWRWGRDACIEIAWAGDPTDVGLKWPSAGSYSDWLAKQRGCSRGRLNWEC